MHKSRLGAIVIDCQDADLDAAGGFWGGLFGCPVQRDPDPAEAKYRKLESPGDEVDILLQDVEHPSRVHLDIESDDLDAEARRLEALGARRVERIRDWLVMEAPTGHRFCIVPPQRPDFAERATQWP